MSRRIAILAAMPAELKPLVKDWRKQPAGKYNSLWTRTDEDGDEIVAACAGMGSNAVRRAFQAAEQRGPLDLAISVGLAGATVPTMRVGEVCCFSEVVSVDTGERFRLGGGERKVVLATSGVTAGAEEKARLLATYGAVMVDMEAATVALLAAMRETPICCFKAVSDTADASLPEIDRFVDANGQLAVGRFLAHVAVRPRIWGTLVRLARNSKQAADTLATSLQAFLVHKDWEFTNRTGSFRKP